MSNGADIPIAEFGGMTLREVALKFITHYLDQRNWTPPKDNQDLEGAIVRISRKRGINACPWKIDQMRDYIRSSLPDPQTALDEIERSLEMHDGDAGVFVCIVHDEEENLSRVCGFRIKKNLMIN